LRKNFLLFATPGESNFLTGHYWFGIPFIIFGIVGIINAINLFDGLDGLAAGVSFIALTIFAVIAFFTGNLSVITLRVALMGALLGFLKYNVYPSRIFMGDTGSMLCGYFWPAWPSC